MDAKDLRTETALGERNDGSKYSQSGVALQCHRNKPYQDIGSNPLAKAEATVRPCAVIGPDRVVPPPASNEAYLKKAPSDLWPCPDNLYPCPPEYKTQNNMNLTRNISPRQTFQENMPRIMVPPSYSAVKHADESNLNHVQDPNAALAKNPKQAMVLDTKYCDVPYAVNLLSNEHKNVRETGMCVPSVNSPLTRTAPHGWSPSGVNIHAPRIYGPHDVYQYPQYPSCAGPRPSAVPIARPHRPFQEEVSYVYPDTYYQDASVRFKPYPSVKERYPPARYDYVSNYPNPFHPPPPYVPHKYDIPNSRTHPYPVYPHLKYLDNRVPDPNMEGYQRSQQSVNYNMQFRNHPSYAPIPGNTQSKVPCYPPDASVKTSNKLPFDNNKAYAEYENAKAKYSLPDSFFVNEMARVHQIQKSVGIPNYTSAVHPAQMQQYPRKDNMSMKTYEYMPHYRHFEHTVGFNPSAHHPPQFSPSALAISPTDSITSNDTQTPGTSQDDCGYVSQSSTTSVRSVDSGIARLHNEYYRRYDYRYRPVMGNPHMLSKPDLNQGNSKDNKKINVRQFLSMWNEVDDDSSSNNNSKEISVPKITDPNNHLRCYESEKSQDQLYVLGLVNVPKEELAKYEHIQKVSKLPENIKGYNSIELLNQFEEVIEFSNMHSSKSSTLKEFMPMKDRKNAIKQIVEALPRPVSPLDVESKISQSVIHKEVGCNFEIKPCSPKMLNVEIATPVQNILGERSIEKVTNHISHKSKSPLSMNINENTVCNKTQRKSSTHTAYGNPSCKMVSSPFTTNINIDSAKTNYSLHDLETSSGVCLASLPRLDNEIELNFPEVNQQFINANKGDCNMLEKYSEEETDSNTELNNLHDNSSAKHDEGTCKLSEKEDSIPEFRKLNKYRKTKVNNFEYSEDESTINAVRTDSVIIENPDNLRRIEENKDKQLIYRTVEEDKNSPMNLTSQCSLRVEIESDTANSPQHKTDECALDFSLGKSEDYHGLPLLNACNDEVIKTQFNDSSRHDILNESVTSDHNLNSNLNKSDDDGLQSSESSVINTESNDLNIKSTIVKDNPNAISDCESELNLSGVTKIYGTLETPAISDEHLIKHLETNIIRGNGEKKYRNSKFEKNKINSVDKATSTNVIVKHKHKFKTAKAKTHKVSNFDLEQRNKIAQKREERLNKKNHNKKKEELKPFNLHESSSHLIDSKRFEQQPNVSSVIQSCSSPNDCEKNVDVILDISKSEKSDIVPNIDSSINTEETVKNDTNIFNRSAEVQEDNNSEIIDTTHMVSKQVQVLESNAEINDSNIIYNNDLISVREQLVDKAILMSTVIPRNSLAREKSEYADDIKNSENLTDLKVLNYLGPRSDPTMTDVTVTDKYLVKNNSELSVPSSETVPRDEEKCLISECKLFDNQKCSNVNDAHSKDSLQDLNDSVEVLEKTIENNVNTSDCIQSSETINTRSGESVVEEMSTRIEDSRKCSKMVQDAEPDESKGCSIIVQDTELADSTECSTMIETAEILVDKHFSTDSGYRSNKNSFTENYENLSEIAENLSEDSVLIENESVLNKVTQNCTYSDRDNNASDILQFVSDTSILSNTSSSLVNKTFDILNSNEKLKISSKKLHSSDLYDSIDANMQILFEQPNETIVSVNVEIDNVRANIEDPKHHLLNINETNKKEISVANIYNSNEECDDVDAVEQELNIQKHKLNKKMQVNFNTDNKESKILDPIYDNETKNKDINTLGDSNVEIKNNQVDLFNSMKITDINLSEPCAKISKEGEKSTEDKQNTLYNIKYSAYRSKTLYSPFIQKLIMFNEGKIHINNDFKIYSLKNIKTILNVATSDYTGAKKESIRVVNPKINVEYDNIYSETFNGKLSPLHNISMDDKNEFDIVYDQENVVGINIDKSISMSLGHVKNDCIEKSCLKNNFNDTQEISFTAQDKSLEINKDENITTENEQHPKFEKCDVQNDSPNIKEVSFFVRGSSPEINIEVNTSPVIENSLEFEKDCIEECDVHNDLMDTQDITFSYSDNSIISQITENILHRNDSILEFKYDENSYKDNIKGSDNINCEPINRCRSLKRSYSDSALNTQANGYDKNRLGVGNFHYTCPAKRNKMSDFENRRNSVNTEENVSFCILIDDNCLITEENDEKICIAELQEDYITEIDTVNNDNDNRSLKELYSSAHKTNVDLSECQIFECEEENPIHESWVEGIAGVDTVFSDEVAENVVISAPSSPTGSTSENEQDTSDIYESAACSHIDKVKFLHGERLSYKDSLIVDTLYKTPHMDIMNKTLLYGDKNIESDNNLSDTDHETVLLESDEWKPSPTHSPDYIDPTHASNYFRLETPENKENVFVKELSPLRRIDDYLDVSSAENETDEHNINLPQHVPELDKITQDGTVHSCESSLDNVFSYKIKDDSISNTTSTSYTTSSSSEVTSTTSEEKNSSILLKITNLNGSRVSQINEIETNNRPRCKFTEKKDYSTSNLNFPNRPLMTKGAQKYIPPIKETIRDLKVKINLPQQSLMKLKQLKLSRSEPKVHKQHTVPRIAKKPKPNFDEVLKSIDEIQIKRHKEKSKKGKTVIPKVVIKKNEYGSHYASTPKIETYNPDLTGRKWQPWVFLEKNLFIDKMAIKSKTRAIYNHRKKTYVLAEKFKKYKSASSTKFIITQPKTPGQLKYTIRLKHTY